MTAPSIPSAIEAPVQAGAPAFDRFGQGSYSHWLRGKLAIVRPAHSTFVDLFESSVPEPVGLLREVVLTGFADAITPRYTSTFARGNPYVIERLAKTYGVGEDSVLSSTGATGALSILYRALLRPGDRVLVENPRFDLFDTLALSQGFGVDFFDREPGTFAVDPDRIEAALTPATRLLVLSNLHNPTGMAIPEETFHSIARLAERRDLIVIVDEVYAPYAHGAVRPVASLGISPRMISIDSLTKIFGLSTLRCGWIVADPKTMAPIRAFSREVEFSISNLSHAVAALVLENPEPFQAYTRNIMTTARPIMERYHARWLDEGLVTGALPEHGCIAFPHLVDISDTLAFSNWLADRGIIVAPGELFGAAGHIRIGFGLAAHRLDSSLRTLEEAIKTYRAEVGTC